VVIVLAKHLNRPVNSASERLLDSDLIDLELATQFKVNKSFAEHEDLTWKATCA